jgi:hypothetical protein
MSTYKLPGGSRVKTLPVGEATEFITSNAQGEVISTVRKSGSEASEMLRALLYADHRVRTCATFNVPERLISADHDPMTLLEKATQ